MIRLVSTKRINAIFLAIVLITGTIAVISPSFIIKGVNAQSELYYEKDTKYSNYETEPEDRDKSYYLYEPEYSKSPDKKYNNYGPEHQSEYKDKEYNSYEPAYGVDNLYNSYKSQNPPEYKDNNNYGPEYIPKYTDDKKYNSYEPKTSYGMDDNNYQKTYGKDNSYDKSQYQSYKPDYKPQYPSYGKDKSKDSSKSVSINKIKCINNNLNINGNNAGNVSLGNKGAAEEGGYLGGYSSGGYNEYHDGYNNKQDKGFDCTINNNNNNTNVSGGNQTISPKATLNVTKLVTCQENINGLTGISVQQAPGPCDMLEDLITEDQYLFNVIDDNPVPSQFAGSESGTVVTLGPGNYVVIETRTTSVDEDVATLVQDPGIESINIQAPIFTGACTEIVPGDRATGTIGAGESQTCNIVNNFVVNVE